MCNAVSTSKWRLQNKGITHWGDRSRVGDRKGGSVGDPREVQRQWRLLYAESRRDKNNLLWCTLDISSPRSTSRLSSVSYELSYRYQQCVYVCLLISNFLPFLDLLSVGFFAPSVLLENLLFFYCCESGWYLICWKNKTFCGFCLTTQINFS